MSCTKHLLIITPAQKGGKRSRIFNSKEFPAPSFGGDIKWSTEDFLDAHRAIVSSGKHNFEGCKIPIPTAIRYDRLKEALGSEITPKEQRVLSLLEFGMPIDCEGKFGVKKLQKNHFTFGHAFVHI